MYMEEILRFDEKDIAKILGDKIAKKISEYEYNNTLQDSEPVYKLYIHVLPSERCNVGYDRYYVGITRNTFEQRWHGGAAYKNNIYFGRAISLYGWDSFAHICISDHLTKEQACELEKECITELNSADGKHGFNISTGGESGSAGVGCVAIDQYDLNGNFIATYKSIKEASERTSIPSASIAAVLSNASVQKSAGGFQFVYHGDHNPGVYVNNVLAAVKQIDTDGNLVAIYVSPASAERITGIRRSSIGVCCNGKVKHAGGYSWGYLDKDAEAKRSYKNRKRYVAQYDSNMILINKFKNAREASEVLGISMNTIQNACRSKKMRHGYIWRYLDIDNGGEENDY